MTAKLVAEEGIQKGLVLSLDEGNEWVIGRDPDACQLLIEDPSTSRKHLLCRRTPDGFFLQNLSSTNPVSINDEEVQEPRLLRNGDLVKIGAGLYRFYSEDEAQLLDNKGELSLDEPNVNQHHLNENKQHLFDQDPILEASPNDQKETKKGAEEAFQPLEMPQEEPIVSKNGEMPEERIETPSEEKIIDQPEETPPKDQEALEKPKIEQKDKSMEQEIEAPPLEKTPLEEALTEKSEEHEQDEEFDNEHISIFEEPAEKSELPEINFDLTETGRWLLKVVGGPNHGAEFTMQPSSTYVIGTDPNSCDIVLHDTSVSRQHAKITVTEEETIILEDLKSRNGTFVDGKSLTGKQTIPTNTLVMMGTSSFIVYDREGEMQTIISPLLPSIVKVLQEEPKKEQPVASPVAPVIEETPKPSESPVSSVAPKKKEYAHDALGAFILIAIITGLFVIIGIGTTTLFKSQPVIAQQVIHPDRDLTQALSAFPNVKYSFNRGTGRLLLVGHVLTASDKNQLLYNLQGFNYIRSIDDSGVIIDEGVWREINQVLSQNPNWKGISIHSPTPGHFVISGYLKSRKQAEQLWDYISTNFPYLDLLEKRVIVEEDVVTAIGSELQNHGFKDVSTQINEGEVTLSGNIQAGKMSDFNKALTAIKDIPGVRSIRNFVAELAPEQSMINISDKYEITGVSHQGSVNTNVIINGRILTRGDILDGMTITSIKPNAVFLEKEGVKYRIDYGH